jgi:hypothetical protein
LKDPLAVRTLTAPDQSSSVRLEIDHPRQAAEDAEADRLMKGDWSCRFRILQSGSAIIDDFAVGSDALEAIVNAISRLRASYERCGLQAYWNEHLIGAGLPSYLPEGLGKDFDLHLKQLVDEEVERRARELENRHSPRGPRARRPR